MIRPPRPPRPPRIRARVLIPCLLLLGLIPVLLWFLQERMIYLPRAYDWQVPQADTPRLWRLPFTTDQGEQTAWYVPPESGGEPTTVWLMCFGNADLALNWRTFAENLSDPHAGALLVDYPSYGICPGQPTPETILASTEGAVAALVARLAIGDLDDRTAIFGHSLGCAAVLQHAARHGATRIVLIAPFTSLMAMARKHVGWPLCQLLRHRYDNLARLAEVNARGPLPITIVHGEADRTIPLAMGRALADSVGARFIAVPDAGHNDVLDRVEDVVRAAMAPVEPHTPHSAPDPTPIPVPAGG